MLFPEYPGKYALKDEACRLRIGPALGMIMWPFSR
jgi:hypothetical protein